MEREITLSSFSAKGTKGNRPEIYRPMERLIFICMVT